MGKDHYTVGYWVALLLVAALAGPGYARDAASSGEAVKAGQIRESVVAGTWYPGSPEELQRQVQSYLDQAPASEFPGRLTTLISPHAGYQYSGQVAAYGYKLLKKCRFSTVVVIAPSHHARFSGVSVYDLGGFRTPLGVVPLDTELISALEKREPRIRYIAEAHTKEHALEIQLPFLQVASGPEFKLVPLVMGDQDLDTSRWLAEALADCIKDRPVLVVASSDLSHYHSYEEAKRLDQVVQDRVAAFDPEGLSEQLATGKCEACGGGPMVAAMLLARKQGATTSRVLRYANSGDVTGDRTRVVGYMAAACFAPNGSPAAAEHGTRKAAVDLGLSPEEKALLHRIARESIEARLNGARPPKVALPASATRLGEPRGAFVTLQKKGELRGCIGHISAEFPLFETISEMAVAAAFQDPRFPPLTASEMKDIQIEISVLSPLRRIEKIDEIQVGVHGIYMKRNGSSGLLLPQVATEYNWDRTTFLEQTCRKSRLPTDAWKDKETEIYLFSADVF
jgi:MEMO1 family protein